MPTRVSYASILPQYGATILNYKIYCVPIWWCLFIFGVLTTFHYNEKKKNYSHRHKYAAAQQPDCLLSPVLGKQDAIDGKGASVNTRKVQATVKGIE
jgi:hypothetical protein